MNDKKMIKRRSFFHVSESENNAYLTGQTLIIDGGFACK
jgi:hypothetical protein